MDLNKRPIFVTVSPRQVSHVEPNLPEPVIASRKAIVSFLENEFPVAAFRSLIALTASGPTFHWIRRATHYVMMTANAN